VTAAQEQSPQQYDVGGLMLPRPFKIRRLGHMGLNMERLDEAITFYCDALGFRITDQINVLDSVPEEARPFVGDVLSDPRLTFTSNCGDHHALVLAHKSFGTLWGNDRKVQDITFVEVSSVLGIIYNSKSGHTQLKWRHVKDDQGRLSGDASTNTLVNLYEAGALDRSFIKTVAARVR